MNYAQAVFPQVLFGAVRAVDAPCGAPRGGVDVGQLVTVDAAKELQVLGGELERRKAIGGSYVVGTASGW